MGTRAAGAEARMAAAAGRKVAVAAVQFACTDVEAENVATAERYGMAACILANPVPDPRPKGAKILAVWFSRGLADVDGC